MAICLAVIGAGGCGSGGGASGGGSSDNECDLNIPVPVVSTLLPNRLNIASFAYQLQNIDLSRLQQSLFGLLVVDYSQDGTEIGRFTAAQVGSLQNGPCGRRPVLAYMSIGEAEDYRSYWNSQWDSNHDGSPDPGAPLWLGPANLDFPGNYKVRYWDPAWQAIIYGSPASYLDQIIAGGFDGVYLDIIDGYEFWGPGGQSGLNRATAEQEMVDFVESLARYARVTKGKSSFLIFPQNGAGLAAHPDYVSTVDGIGSEDTWFNGNRRQSTCDTLHAISNLDVFRGAGKLVLCIDYATQPDLIEQFYSSASTRGYIPYATARGLDRLTLNHGHEPNCAE